MLCKLVDKCNDLEKYTVSFFRDEIKFMFSIWGLQEFVNKIFKIDT